MSELTFSDQLLVATHLGDPLADAVVRRFQQLPGGHGWRALDTALAIGHAEDDALEALLAAMREPPAWVDLDLADAGAVATWRIGSFPLFLALTYGSLAFGYQSARLSRPLAATGRLEVMAGRRLGETSRWYVAATSPGGMRPGAPGWTATVRVRLVHALVRDHLARTPGWDHEQHGVPINAADAFATAIAGFFVVPMRALHDLGVRLSPAELEAIHHLWCWIGCAMGVPEHLLPTSADDARQKVDEALALDEGPDEAGPRLMRALLDHGLPLPGPTRKLSAHVTGGLARRWMGDEMADRLGVPASPLRHLVPLVRPAAKARHVVLSSGVLGSDARIAELELKLVHHTLKAVRSPRQALAPDQAATRPTVRDAA